MTSLFLSDHLCSMWILLVGNVVSECFSNYIWKRYRLILLSVLQMFMFIVFVVSLRTANIRHKCSVLSPAEPRPVSDCLPGMFHLWTTHAVQQALYGKMGWGHLFTQDAITFLFALYSLRRIIRNVSWHNAPSAVFCFVDLSAEIHLSYTFILCFSLWLHLLFLVWLVY